MSLLGKVLVVLNILGAAGLVYLGATNYAKRRIWAHRVFEHELAIRGLPLDAQERDERGRPIAGLIGEETQKDLFAGVAGQPVRTQQEEVDRVKNAVLAPLQGVTDKRKQLFLYARVLLPLARSYLEREGLLAYRTHLADDKKADALKKRYEQAFKQAVDRPGEDFEKVFRQAVESQPGEPSEVFTRAFLQALPRDPAKARAANFDATFEKSIEAQAAELEKRFQKLLPTANDPPDRRKAATARFLVAMCPVLAEDDLAGPQGDPKDKASVGGARSPAEYQEKLAGTTAYKNALTRTLAVVGVRALADTVSRRAGVLRQQAEDVSAALADDRGDFVTAQQSLLRQVQERAYQVELEAALLDRQQKLLEAQRALVDKRRGDVKVYEEALAEERQKTARRLAELQQMSENLYKLRLATIKALDDNQKAAETIRKLEGEIRELGTKADARP
jgi:hypothetical protein